MLGSVCKNWSKDKQSSEASSVIDLITGDMLSRDRSTLVARRTAVTCGMVSVLKRPGRLRITCCGKRDPPLGTHRVPDQAGLAHVILNLAVLTTRGSRINSVTHVLGGVPTPKCQHIVKS